MFHYVLVYYDYLKLRISFKLWKRFFFPGPDYLYKGYNTNAESNGVIDIVEYHVNPLPQFQDIVDKSGEKGNVGGWLSIRMNLGKRPFVCLGQDKALFRQYIFTKQLWTYKFKCWIDQKDKGYGNIISAFQSLEFDFGYPLTVTDLQTINWYCVIHPNCVDTDAATTILGHTHKEPITIRINPFF